MEETTNAGILEDIQHEINLEPVSPGIRFANFIIDLITFYAGVFLISLVWALIVISNGSRPALNLGTAEQYLLSYVLYFLFYSIIEGASKGRTVGKLCTRTVVLKEDGSSITFNDAMMRSLCRLIPFEPFSAFGYHPWHDSFSKTIVVKKMR